MTNSSVEADLSPELIDQIKRAELLHRRLEEIRQKLMAIAIKGAATKQPCAEIKELEAEQKAKQKEWSEVRLQIFCALNKEAQICLFKGLFRSIDHDEPFFFWVIGTEPQFERGFYVEVLPAWHGH
jgi:hypothetical protein